MRDAWKHRLRGGAIGLAAGLFGGLAGLGGGVVMVPLMTGWARTPQHVAHGTSLVAVVAVGAAGSVSYATGGAVAWGTAAAVAAGSTLGALAGAGLSPRVPASALRRLFGALVILAALLLPLEGLLPAAVVPESSRLPAALLVGTGAGALSGLLGIGGGSIIVPLLVLAFGFDQHLAQGTSLAIMIPAGVAGSVVHARLGQVDVRLAPMLALGVAAGAWAGGQAALAMPEGALRWLFAATMVALGARWLRGGRRARPATPPGG